MRPSAPGPVLVTLFAVVPLLAQSPHRHANGVEHVHASPGPLRLWSNATTGESLRGALLATGEDSVSIERENGAVVVLALADLASADRAEVERHRAAVVARNTAVGAAPQSRPQSGPTQRLPFDAFAPAVKTRWDERWLYVESDGLPHAPLAHTPMVGIASRQQQVPLPQQRGERGGGRGALARLTEFKTEVPGHPFDLVLVRPTATSITVSVVAYADGEGQVEFGESATALTKRTAMRTWKRMEPVAFVLEGLRPDAQHCYRLRWRAGQGEFAVSDVQGFHTPRAAGASFVFTIQADSHLDTNVDPAVYARTLANAREEHPDFHVDLGDTFMTDKRREFRTTEPQYFAQRWYLGQLCSTAPLFMALGNHDGEYGYAGGAQDGMAAWSHAQRTRLFPPPEIETKAPRTYTGRTEWRDGSGGNWYAFTWGDALCVVLDPFSMTRERPRGGGGPEAEFVNTDQNWTRTLGREQYDWLAATLAGSKARYKFVFLHHLVGGFGRAARGGVEAAPFFEWGGKNADGSDGFARHRPGWAKPIHALLVEHGVNAVFHGHDHLYVHAELDGVTYQCVPQPGNARGGTRSAGEYGYVQGTILGSPGHLRVSVSANEAKVAYVHATTGGDGKNGSVVAEYSLSSRRKP